MKNAYRFILIQLNLAMSQRRIYIDIKSSTSIDKLLKLLVEGGYIRNYYIVRGYYRRVYLRYINRGYPICKFYIIKGDKYRNWYPHNVFINLDWGRKYIYLGHQGLDLSYGGKNLKEAIHILAQIRVRAKIY